MQNIFKNKLFIIISLFIILVTFISSSCFASFDFNYNNTDYSFPDFEDILNNLNYNTVSYIIGYGDINNNIKNKYKLFIFNADISSYSNIYLKQSSNSGDQFVYLYGDLNNSTDIEITCYGFTYYFDGSNWVQIGDNFNAYRFYAYDVIYSTHNIYNYNNNLVFQAPPQQVEAVTIPAIQQVGEIPQGMNQVLQVIIPIGLIVLSIGLVVYLMRLVIYRMK